MIKPLQVLLYQLTCPSCFLSLRLDLHLLQQKAHIKMVPVSEDEFLYLLSSSAKLWLLPRLQCSLSLV